MCPATPYNWRVIAKVQQKKLLAELDALGLKAVRIKVYQGEWARLEKRAIVDEWIKQQEERREDEHRDESLEIAREANDIALGANEISRSAKNFSIWAFVASLGALAIAAYVAFLK